MPREALARQVKPGCLPGACQKPAPVEVDDELKCCRSRRQEAGTSRLFTDQAGLLTSAPTFQNSATNQTEEMIARFGRHNHLISGFHDRGLYWDIVPVG